MLRVLVAFRHKGRVETRKGNAGRDRCSKFRKQALELVYKVGAAFDNRPCSLLQIVLHPFQKRGPYFHMQVLPESDQLSINP